MSDAFLIAASGLRVQTQRINASAANLANITTTGAPPAGTGTASATSATTTAAPATVYTPVTVSQTASAGGGTTAVYTPITNGWFAAYAPTDTAADANGMVAAPDVDVGQETVNQVTANAAYKAGAAVMRTADEMSQALLDIKS